MKFMDFQNLPFFNLFFFSLSLSGLTHFLIPSFMTFLVVQTVRSLPAVQETWVQSLVWEDPLEKEMMTHSSFLSWKIPWTEEPRSPWGHRESDMTGRLHFLSFSYDIEEERIVALLTLHAYSAHCVWPEKCILVSCVIHS